MKKRYPLFAIIAVCCIGYLLGNPGAASAGLFGKDEEAPVAALAPAEFDFSTAEKNPEQLLAKELTTDTTGKGIKKLKKVAVVAYVIRFRKDMSNDVVSSEGRGFSVDYEVLDEPELFQKLTDESYDRFVTGLKGLGLEVVDISVLASQDGYKRGRDKAKNNGRIEKFASTVGVGQRDGDSGETKSTLSSLVSDMAAGVEYYVHFASKAPEVNYPHSMSYDATGYIGSATERVADPGPISPALIDAASKAGVGLLFVGFEVRMGKYSFTNQTFNGGVFTSTKLGIHITPMVRTQLLSLKITPEGATSPTFYVGVDDSLRASDGFLAMPAPYKVKSGMLDFKGKKLYPWIEDDGGDPWKIADFQTEEGKSKGPILLKLNPDTVAPAFNKCIDAYRHLLIAAIKREIGK